MKKGLIALAVAGAFVAPVAMADTSNVNIYGSASMSFDSASSGNGMTTANGATAGNSSVSTNQINSNTSKLGFKGSEDLGDGLSAIWQIEQQINMDGGTAAGASGTTFATRNTFAGLKSESMGTVLLGLHDTPYKIATRNLDLFADRVGDNRSLMGGVATNAAGTTGSAAASFDGRQGNVLAYISPAMSGFTVAAAYVAGAEAATTVAGGNKGSAWSLAGLYSAGPLFGSLAYEAHDLGTAGSGSIAGGNIGVAPVPKETAWKFGLGYTMDQFLVNFVYEKTNDNFGGATGLLGAGTSGSSQFGHNAYYLAGKFNVSANDAVKLAYTKVGRLDRTGIVPGVGVQSNQNSGAKQITLGYDHNLSKRTMVYATYTKLTNEVGANYTLSNYAAGNGFGTSPSVVSLGMKHDF